LNSSSDVLDGIFPVVVVAAPADTASPLSWLGGMHGSSSAEFLCAWLSLDEDDNDAARFLRHLIAALQKASAHVGKNIAEDLIADFASGFKVCAGSGCRRPRAGQNTASCCSSMTCNLSRGLRFAEFSIG